MSGHPIRLVAAIMLAMGALAGGASAAQLPADSSAQPAAQPALARLAVLVLANGGKFVGDDIGGALVTIRDARTKEVLASGRTQGGAGLPDLPTIDVNQLHVIPETDAARFVAHIPVDGPRLVEVTAFGPLAALGSAVDVSTTVWLLPPSISPSNRVVLTLRGLVVQLISPPTHFLPASPAPLTIPIRANVTMMCGCPIGPALPWKPEEYVVQATIRDATGRQITVPLTFDTQALDGAPSQFVGSWTAPAAGVYEVTVIAHQLTHDNTGVDRGTVIVSDAR
ncbi:MAG: hypothetical protein KatS3mg060_3372 [Dehalococcoidia bacterium]|jgi:hypothetical protein|nr:MAG: hypothetical protein KatS3mg060_3372 [Dehalococcoidia bacterium]